ncbi:MAG: hypothetical protein AAF265_10395 [Pseudomonadota bacterium]
MFKNFLSLILMLTASTAALASWDDHSFALVTSSTPAADFGVGSELAARRQRLDWRGKPRQLGDVRTAIGFTYAYTRYEYSNIASRNRDLHFLQIPIVAFGGSDRWRWQTRIVPGVATSSNVMKDPVNRLTLDDLYTTGEVLFQKQQQSGSFVFGITHDRRFGQSQTYPKLAWRGASDRFQWQIGAPDAWLDYQPRDGTTFSLGAGPAGMQWHTVRDDFASDFDYRVRRWDIRLDFRQKLFSRLAVTVFAGRGLDRRHRFQADAPNLIERSADDAWFAGVSFGWGGVNRFDGYAEAW